MTAIIECDGEMMKYVHAAKDEWAMFMGREYAPNANGVITDLEWEPAAVHTYTASFNAEENILRRP